MYWFELFIKLLIPFQFCQKEKMKCIYVKMNSTKFKIDAKNPFKMDLSNNLL